MANATTPRIALTPGEPAGIGPDLVVRLAQTQQNCEIVAVADPAMLRARAQLLGLPLTLQTVDYNAPATPSPAGVLRYDTVPCAATAAPGTLNPANADYVLETINRAVWLCQHHACAAMVTGPIHKGIINDAGTSFSGHTGYLAQRCGSDEPVMMLATDDGALRVALATVHIPLAAVPKAITRASLTHCIRTLHTDLQARFGINKPRILVAGLNPHAGEDGYLGHEDIDIIRPVIEAEQARGYALTGPLPADTLFTREHLRQADAVLAMYHDQGLPVIKHMGFGRTVNISLGLPIIRTSVDHGTALDRAGQNNINTGSLHAAINTAMAMVKHTHGA